MAKNCIFIRVSAGEFDFIGPYIFLNENKLNRTAFFISKKLKIKFEKDILFLSITANSEVDYLNRRLMAIARFLCCLVKNSIFIEFTTKLPTICVLFKKLFYKKNIKVFPHTGFYYYPYKINSKNYKKRDLSHNKLSTMLIQSKRYTPNLSKFKFKRYEITGYFHEEDKFIKHIDKISKYREWPPIVLLSNKPRSDTWPEDEFYEIHSDVINSLDEILPEGIDIGFKPHPRVRTKLNITKPRKRKLFLETQSALLLARNAKFVLCLGHSSVVYNAIHMKTPYLVFYNRLEYIKNQRGVTDIFDPEFNINVYDKWLDFQPVLENRLKKIFHKDV